MRLKFKVRTLTLKLGLFSADVRLTSLGIFPRDHHCLSSSAIDLERVQSSCCRPTRVNVASGFCARRSGQLKSMPGLVLAHAHSPQQICSSALSHLLSILIPINCLDCYHQILYFSFVRGFLAFIKPYKI